MSSSANQSDSDNDNQLTIQTSDDPSPSSSGVASSSNSTIDQSKPVGVNAEGQPIYDRTGITIYETKKHEGTDGKRLCGFGGSNCTQRPMKGYDFCIKHILQEPTAPFKRCEFVPTGKKQCGNPVKLDESEKTDDFRFCNTHKQKLGITTSKKKKKKEGRRKNRNRQGSKGS